MIGLSHALVRWAGAAFVGAPDAAALVSGAMSKSLRALLFFGNRQMRAAVAVAFQAVPHVRHKMSGGAVFLSLCEAPFDLIASRSSRKVQCALHEQCRTVSASGSVAVGPWALNAVVALVVNGDCILAVDSRAYWPAPREMPGQARLAKARPYSVIRPGVQAGSGVVR